MTQPLLAKPVALIVEDEILVRMMAVDVFEQAGFSVLEASNATEAMAILGGRDDVAALFTDIEMPGGPSGLVLAHEIHALHPGMVLLIASGHFVPRAKDIPNGAEYFRKPYDPDHVVARAHEMITDPSRLPQVP